MGNGGQINTGVKSWKSFGVKSWKSGFDERRLHVASMKPSSLIQGPGDQLAGIDIATCRTSPRMSSSMQEWPRGSWQ